MTEDQINRMITEARELAEICFNSFKDNIEKEILPQLSTDQQKSYFFKERDHLSTILIKIPSYLKKPDEDIVQQLSVNLIDSSIQELSSLKPEIDPLFTILLKAYKTVIRDDEFMSSLSKLRPQYFSETFYEWKYISENTKSVLNYIGEPYNTTVFQSGFYNVIHIIVYTYYLFLIRKKEYLEPIITEFWALGNGLNCSHSQDEKKKLFKKLKGKYIQCTMEEHFLAAMTPEPLPYGFQKIKWVLLTKFGNPHKTAFREFLSIHLERVPHQNDINRIFRDNNNNNISIPNRKNEYSNYYNELEKMHM